MGKKNKIWFWILYQFSAAVTLCLNEKQRDDYEFVTIINLWGRLHVNLGIDKDYLECPNVKQNLYLTKFNLY